MDKLDRIVKQQIEDATRPEYGRVKVVNQAKIAPLGGADYSNQPVPPVVLWRVEDFINDVGQYPNEAYIKSVFDNRSSGRTIYVLTSTLNGGITTSLNGVVPGVNRILMTKVRASSDRNISTKISGYFTDKNLGSSTIDRAPTIAVYIKRENDAGTLIQDWIRRYYYNVAVLQQPLRFDSPFTLSLKGGEWATIGIFLYTGVDYRIDVIEALKDIAFGLDATEFVTGTPPSAPEWGSTPITTQYLDEQIGTSVNTLTIKTPTERDWLGVGIYRVEVESLNDFRQSGQDVHRATRDNNTDLYRDYRWPIYGSNGDYESYYFSSEESYQKNLIPNATFFRSSAHWRRTVGGTGSDTIRLVRRNPFSPPLCLKASANYSAASKFNMVITSSTIAVDSSKAYKFAWYVKKDPLVSAMASSKAMSAIQINYYRDSNRNLVSGTPYQILPVKYDDTTWTKYESNLYPIRYWATANPSKQTGASVLGQFVMPSYCTHIDLNFKMWHNHSSRGIFYFDGADFELDSGQPLTYNKSTSYGVILQPAYALTSEESESTAFGIFRIPFRGSVAEIYSSHTSVGYGDNLYLSSAHWSKFAKAFDAGRAAVNRIKNGSFLSWSGNTPNNWSFTGPAVKDYPVIWKASTAIYGSTTIGMYWREGATGGGGITQAWGGADRKEITYSFWLKVDTGAVKVGDSNRTGTKSLEYKEPKHWWYSASSVYAKDAGPSHLNTNVKIVGTDWTYQQIHLSTSDAIFITSDKPGTRCYIDGVQANWNIQSGGTVRNYPTIFDPLRIVGGSTAKADSYVKCSANSLGKANWTIRCWYHPSYPWYLKSTTTGRYEMPRPVIWSYGDDANTATNKKHLLYYIPFRNTDSSGGFFEWYGMNFNKRITLSGPRIEFKPWDPIHLVAICYSGENTVEFGQNTKLYVNGISVDSSRAKGLYGTNAFLSSFHGNIDNYDNIVIGAYKGYETTTAVSYQNIAVTTSYGHANGLISEFRVDNYAWDETQVTTDYVAERPRYRPGAPMDHLIYSHIADRIRDGSEQDTFTYEDTGVKVGNYYSYSLDAYDYLNNRSPMSATAAVTAGDNVPPGQPTNTGHALNKGQSITFKWTNPSDSDFAVTKVYDAGVGFATFDIVPGLPGQRSSWTTGFLGYGVDKVILLQSIDKAGNAATPVYVTGRTRKGPLTKIEGNILQDLGGGIGSGRQGVYKAGAATWGNIYTDPSNPRLPQYKDLYAYIHTQNSAYPTIIKAPIKLGSVSGLAMGTSYHLYLIDSASGRANALRMRWALNASTADSATAYPLGIYFTGNSTARGHFIPDQSVGMNPSQSIVVAPRIESPSGDTYIDLQNSVIHNEDTLGNYSEIRSGGINYYDSAMGKMFAYPKGIYVINPGLIDAGSINTYSSWGLKAFTNPPEIVLVPTNVKTYCTAPGFGMLNHTAQSLFIGFSSINHTQCTPVVKLMTSKQVQTNLSFANGTFAPTTGPYSYPVKWDVVYQVTSGINTACAWDTATGGTTGSFSGIGPNNSTSIARVEIEISFIASAQPRIGGQHLKLKWMTHYCSAYASSYTDHGAPSATISSNHRVWYNDAANSIVLSTQNKRVKWTKVITRDFTTPGPIKPLVTWAFASAQPKAYGAQPASEIVWTSDLFASSGARWINDMKLERITYYTKDGLEYEQTGRGLVTALVIDKG